jgi:hypothetical protein
VEFFSLLAIDDLAASPLDLELQPPTATAMQMIAHDSQWNRLEFIWFSSNREVMNRTLARAG